MNTIASIVKKYLLGYYLSYKKTTQLQKNIYSLACNNLL